jgi:SAM-dependent methyltransferase
MRLPVGPEDYARHVAPRLLAAPAELVLSALPEMAEGARVLEIAWTSGVLTQGLADELSSRDASLTALEERPLELRLDLPGNVRRLQGKPGNLPFDDDSFEVVVANLALLGRHEDDRLLAEARRVLAPGGTLCASVLMAGSFQELFDILTEVSEQESLSRVRGHMNDARRALYEREALESAMQDAGFEVDLYGEERRALWFGGGKQAVSDPLVWQGLVAGWLNGTPKLPDRFGQAAARFIDTYFQGERFPVLVRTAVIRALAE